MDRAIRRMVLAAGMAGWAAAAVLLASGAHAGQVRQPGWLQTGPVRTWSVCDGGHGGQGVQVWSSAAGHGKGLVCKSGQVFGSRTP